MRLAETRSDRLDQEKGLLCEQVDIAKGIAKDWMNEAIGYRESYEAGLKKIKILENHMERIKREFKERQDQLQLEYEDLKEQCALDRDKIQ